MSESTGTRKSEKKARGRKRDGPEKRLAATVEDCEKEFQRWNDLYEFGGSDPSYADGVNLKLVRNHIIYYKKKIEDLCAEIGSDLPEIYHQELPPDVPSEYMARADEIRKEACKALAEYEKNPYYLALCKKEKQISPKQKKEVCLAAVMGYVSGLRQAIAEDDLVVMRRHRYSDRYAESFQSCLERIEKLPSETYQLTLFDMTA